MYQIKPYECVRACIASLFEVALDDVPEFEHTEWEEGVRDYLQTRSLTTITVSLAQAPEDYVLPLGYTIGAVDRGNSDGMRHGVVCLDGYAVWCPVHGPQPGTERAQTYTILYPLDPWNMPEWRARL